MNKNILMVIIMTLLTASALGVVVFAIGQEAHSLAVSISTVSLMINIALSTQLSNDEGPAHIFI
jgi:hypothetical protein